MTEKILSAIKELREKSKKRNFPQSFDLIVSFKELDLKKPENKFTEDLILPNGRGEETNVVVFSDSIRNDDFSVMTESDIEKLAKNKREAKKLVKNSDFFLAESKLMPVVGKNLGQLIAPRGKMPKPISGDIESLVENYKKSIRIKIKDSPVVQCLVGNEKMEDDKIAENIETVLKFLETKLPKGKHNIGKVLLKLTMSKPVRIEV